jgi:hypothetical protein
MKNPSQISEYIARQCRPELFRVPRSRIYHVALLAFPQTSQTLCGLPLVQLEPTPNAHGYLHTHLNLLCDQCTLKLGLLAARLLT